MNAENKSLKILLIQYRPSGDVLLLTPVVKVLKEKFPGSKISFMVNEKESAIIRDNRLIDELVLIKKLPKKRIRDYINYLKYNYSIIYKLRGNFDVVIDFIGNPRSALTTLFSKANVRIGRKGARDFAYNRIIEKSGIDMNTISLRLSHLRPLGINAEYTRPEIYLNEKDIQYAKEYIKSLRVKKGRPVIFLAPNSPRSSRRWKAGYFSELGQLLIKKNNAKVLLAWGPGEFEYTENILAGIGDDAEMIPETSLIQMAAIISHSCLMITNDSSPKHIANALGVRTIAIYGPTNPKVWNDLDTERNPAVRADVPCIQCEKRECPLEEHVCMTGIKPAVIMKIIGNILPPDR